MYQNTGPLYNGYYVRNIQVALNLAGISTTVDGAYGPQTLANVRTFQAANGLPADGIAGPVTYGVMDRLLANAAQLTYAWFACTAAIPSPVATMPGSCTVLSPAVTSTTFTPTSAHVGKFITVKVTGSKSGVNSTIFTAAPTAVGTAPANSSAATITGTARVGSTLTATPGTWTGTPSPTVSLTWVRCAAAQSASSTTLATGCATISGATGSTYVLTSTDLGKFISVSETATNAVGTATLISPSTAVVVAAPTPTPTTTSGPVLPETTDPAITGTIRVGQALTATTGTWTPVSPYQDFGPTYNGYFVRNIQTALKGAGIAVTVDGIYGSGTAAAVSTFQSKKGLTVDGIVGPQTWNAMVTVLTNMTKFSYRWYSCSAPVATATSTIPATCSAIAGASAKTYRPVATDVGKFVTVMVTGTKAGTVTKQLVASTTAVAP